MQTSQLLPSLEALYKSHQGYVSLKWQKYLAIYDELFMALRQKQIRMLEVGVQNGGSLEIWAKYFLNAQLILGCDINEACKKLRYSEDCINVIVGDINTHQTITSIESHCQEYDIVIDDGSHKSGDIINAFVHLFPMLSDGGIYIVEDINTSYMHEFDGGLFDPSSSISFFKYCIDVINSAYWCVNHEPKDIFGDGFYKKYGVVLNNDFLSEIDSIAFVDSMCIIKKARNKANFLCTAGKIEPVLEGNLLVDGMVINYPSQQNNVWSQKTTTDEALLSELSITEIKVMMDRNLSEIKQLSVLVDQLKAENVRLVESEQYHIQLYHSMIGSTSWRLTKPFRYIAGLLKKIKPIKND